MTKAISVDDLIDEQKALLEDVEQTRQAMHEARAEHAKKKSVFMKFNDKYGRVIAMMNED